MCSGRGCWDINADDCQRCALGSYINAGNCTSNCPTDKFIGSLDPVDDPNGVYACIPCDSSCASCTGALKTQCTSCPSGLAVHADGLCGYCDILADGYFYNGTCVLQCPPGFWDDGDTVSCMPCSSNCSQCAGGSSLCTACKPGSYLSSSICYNTCPPGQYGIDGQWQCFSCTTGVRIYLPLFLFASLSKE